MSTVGVHTPFRKITISGVGEKGDNVETIRSITAKQLAAVELSIVFILIIVQVWMFDGVSLVPAGLAVSIVVAGWILRKKSLRDIGLIDLRWTIPAIVILWGKLAFGRSLGNQHDINQMALGFVGYFPWALFQQIILNGFFADQLRTQMRGALVPLSAGILFGAVHIPNPVLAPVAFLGGVAASYVFLRAKRRNVYIIALAHAVVAVVVFYLIPMPWHHHFAVGPRFWMHH